MSAEAKSTALKATRTNVLRAICAEAVKNPPGLHGPWQGQPGNQGDGLRYNEAQARIKGTRLILKISFPRPTSTWVSFPTCFKLSHIPCTCSAANANAACGPCQRAPQVEVTGINAGLMEQTQFCCPICSLAYNTSDRRPLLVCNQQHDVCSDCVAKLKDGPCPSCRAPLTPVKAAIIERMMSNIKNFVPSMNENQPTQLFIRDQPFSTVVPFDTKRVFLTYRIADRSTINNDITRSVDDKATVKER
jgi:hypothetical protein